METLQKPIRIVDPEVLRAVRKAPCLACGRHPTDAHHVSTRGSGGGDTYENVMPLCSGHHRLWHDVGAREMCEAFPAVRYWLELAGRFDVLERAGLLCQFVPKQGHSSPGADLG